MFGDLFASAAHAVKLVLDDAARVDPRLLVLGTILYLTSQAVRSRGWHTILRSTFPKTERLRARDTCRAYLAGAGANAVIPARGGDVVKLALVRRRIEDAPYSTLAGTFVPETAFETLFGTALVIWALARGLLPIPRTSGELPSLDVTTFIDHPFRAIAVVLVIGAALALLVAAMRRRRPSGILRRFRHGMTIFRTPRLFITGVASWQAFARLIRLGSLAAFMAAFDLPVTATTVVLVMAAQGGGRIIPLAPVSAGLRLAMLSYGFEIVTGHPVAIGQITVFTFGVGAVLMVAGLLVSAAILMTEFRTADPRKALRSMSLLDQDRGADGHSRVQILDVPDVHPQTTV